MSTDMVEAVVLAAGKGTRMGGNLPKPIVPFKGEPMTLWILKALKKAGVDTIITVIGHGAGEVRQALGEASEYVFQSERLGTAHAVRIAAESRLWEGKDVIVFVGDAPTIRPETIRKLILWHREAGASCTFLTADFSVHFPYARVVRNAHGKLIKCVEERNASEEELKIKEYLTSHFIFRGDDLLSYLSEIKAHPRTGEFYLTDMIDLLLEDGKVVETLKIKDFRELVGLNTPEELQEAEKYFDTENQA